MPLRVVLVCAALAVSSGCGSSPHPRIAVPSGIMEPFPMYLCRDLGFLREEGIEAPMEELAGNKSTEALIGGSVDVTYQSASAVLTAAGGGKHLKVFFVGQRTGSAMLIVPAAKAGRIHGIGDLKGGTVGVAALGSPQHSLLDLMLRRNGVDPASVRVVTHGTGPSAIAALEHGNEDAGMINGSAFNLLRRRQSGMRVLVDPRTPKATEELYGSRDYANFSLIATPEWLASHPETARKLARAMRRTMIWIRGHPAEEVLARMPSHLRSSDPEADLESLRLIIQGLSEDGRMGEGSPELLRQLAGVSLGKLREHGIELSRLYTNEFLPEAK